MRGGDVSLAGQVCGVTWIKEWVGGVVSAPALPLCATHRLRTVTTGDMDTSGRGGMSDWRLLTWHG